MRHGERPRGIGCVYAGAPRNPVRRRLRAEVHSGGVVPPRPNRLNIAELAPIEVGRLNTSIHTAFVGRGAPVSQPVMAGDDIRTPLNERRRMRGVLGGDRNAADNGLPPKRSGQK